MELDGKAQAGMECRFEAEGATTHFFTSFIPAPAVARKGCYSYLLGLVSLYEGKTGEAAALFDEGYRCCSDNLFCHYFHSHIQ